MRTLKTFYITVMMRKKIKFTSLYLHIDSASGFPLGAHAYPHARLGIAGEFMLLGVRRLRLQRKRRPFEPRVQSSQGKLRRVEIRFRFSILLLEQIL